MAKLSNLVRVSDQPTYKTSVSGDYCFDSDYFQIRTYKAGDTNRTDGQKQNIQFDREMAESLVDLLNQFIKQDQ